MSLGQIKAIYCIAVVLIVLVLVYAAGLIGLVAAVLILAGALPMFRAVSWAAESQGADKAIADLRRRWHAHHAGVDEEAAVTPHRPANQQ